LRVRRLGETFCAITLESAPVSDSNPHGLLDSMRHARGEAIRARRLSRQIPDDRARTALWNYADDMEAKVTALESEASNLIS
jgi:hypothetical protein